MGESDSLVEFLAIAVDATKKAGEIIRKGFHQAKHVEHKMFTGILGKGAFLNGNKINVSSQTELVKSLLATKVKPLCQVNLHWKKCFGYCI
uniref:Uncharacterized protein n=1 Tax=Nelumbo nucifera TaxID=4432 RepID=A0A822Y2J4_NELNU|nr:TPA_asm: hypothetical protein HUJ06_029592 [Nelumbo nucifera]